MRSRWLANARTSVASAPALTLIAPVAAAMRSRVSRSPATVTGFPATVMMACRVGSPMNRPYTGMPRSTARAVARSTAVRSGSMPSLITRMAWPRPASGFSTSRPRSTARPMAVPCQPSALGNSSGVQSSSMVASAWWSLVSGQRSTGVAAKGSKATRRSGRRCTRSSALSRACRLRSGKTSLANIERLQSMAISRSPLRTTRLSSTCPPRGPARAITAAASPLHSSTWRSVARPRLAPRPSAATPTPRPAWRARRWRPHAQRSAASSGSAASSHRHQGWAQVMPPPAGAVRSAGRARRRRPRRSARARTGRHSHRAGAPGGWSVRARRGGR